MTVARARPDRSERGRFGWLAAGDLGPRLGPGVEVRANVAAPVETGHGRRVPVPDVLEVLLVGGMELLAPAGCLLLGLGAGRRADRRLTEEDGHVRVGLGRDDV